MSDVRNNRIRLAASAIAGLLFGAGLYVSHMADPARVRGFLDVGGAWQPDLMFVMGSALAVHAGVVRWTLRRGAPLADDHVHLPALTRVDTKLVVGSALFGIGWAIAGICPGPAVVTLGLGVPSSGVFFAAMAAGMLAHRLLFGGPPPELGAQEGAP